MPQPLPAETVALAAALGRVAAEDARSAVDLPPFDRSAMDGYALRAADTDPPAPLALAGEVAAGEVAPERARARDGARHHDRRRGARGRGRDPARRGQRTPRTAA